MFLIDEDDVCHLMKKYVLLNLQYLLNMNAVKAHMVPLLKPVVFKGFI